MKFRILFLINLYVTIALISLLSSCDVGPTDEKIEAVIESSIDSFNLACSEEDEKVFASIRNGNYAYVEEYLENGGNPNLCCDRVSWSASLNRECLHMAIADSAEFVKYYLTYNVADYVLNDLLEYYVFYPNKEMVELLIKEGAHFSVYLAESDNWLEYYTLLDKCNYDFNWQDPERIGFTLLMAAADIESDEADEVAIAIEQMKFLLDHGAKTDIKDFRERSLLDVAVNEKIIQFIKELEK